MELLAFLLVVVAVLVFFKLLALILKAGVMLLAIPFQILFAAVVAVLVLALFPVALILSPLFFFGPILPIVLILFGIYFLVRK